MLSPFSQNGGSSGSSPLPPSSSWSESQGNPMNASPLSYPGSLPPTRPTSASYSQTNLPVPGMLQSNSSRGSRVSQSQLGGAILEEENQFTQEVLDSYDDRRSIASPTSPASEYSASVYSFGPPGPPQQGQMDARSIAPSVYSTVRYLCDTQLSLSLTRRTTRSNFPTVKHYQHWYGAWRVAEVRSSVPRTAYKFPVLTPSFPFAQIHEIWRYCLRYTRRSLRAPTSCTSSRPSSGLRFSTSELGGYEHGISPPLLVCLFQLAKRLLVSLQLYVLGYRAKISTQAWAQSCGASSSAKSSPIPNSLKVARSTSC